MIAGIKETGSFFEHAQRLSIAHHDTLLNLPVDQGIHDDLLHKVHESERLQAQMEQDNVGDFEDFLASYLNQIHKADSVDA